MLAVKKTKPANYRPEVDGIRAIAVLSVVLFHWDVSSIFNGGFIGVDVFFVISGYLITNILVKSLDDSSFSFIHFYSRRARRLMPVYIVVLALCIIFSFFILTPPLLKNFGGALIHALYSIQNFYLMNSVGYFDLGALTRPLLHTWSLSVEEQYYLVYPLILFILYKCKSKMLAFVVLTLMGAISLVSGFLFSDINSSFYFTPFRFFEFLIGAVLCMRVVKESASNKLILEFVSTLGLGLVFYSIYDFSTDTPFPSFYTLIPCLGTAMLIYGGGSTFIGKILSLKPVVGVGLLSYSIYLVHWPILTLYRLTVMRGITDLEKFLLFVSTFVTAYILYRYVEQPLRYKKNKDDSNSQFWLGCTVAILVLLLPAGFFWGKDGLPRRFQSNINYEEYTNELQKMNDESNNTFVEQTVDTFENISPDRIRIVVIGDSHSVDISNAFLQTKSLPKKIALARLEWVVPCIGVADMSIGDRILGVNRPCQNQISKVKESKLILSADLILFVNWWKKKYIKVAYTGFEMLKSLTKAPVVIVGINESFPFLHNAIFKTGLNISLNKSQYDLRDRGAESIDQTLESYAKKLGFIFVNRRDLVCDKSTKECQLYSVENNHLYYNDDNHWSLYGERLFGPKLVKRISDELGRAGHELNFEEIFE